MSGTNLRWALTAGLPATLFLLAAVPASSPVTRISGKLTMKYVQQHPLAAADAAGPVVFANQARGTNLSTGKTEYMDGAEITSIEIADLTQGTGTHQGYITFAKKGDGGVNRWNGRVSTTMSANNQPVTTFEGTWTKISGSGRYQGVTGRGRYRGRVVSPTEYVVEWDGEIDLKDNTAAR